MKGIKAEIYFDSLIRIFPVLNLSNGYGLSFIGNSINDMEITDSNPPQIISDSQLFTS